MSSPPPILETSSYPATDSPISSYSNISPPYSERVMSSRSLVAFARIPDSFCCRTTVVRVQNTVPPIIAIYSWESAGLQSIPTGGSCAASPMSTSLQSTPLRTKVTRSSSRFPLPKDEVDCCCPPSMPMSDTSSTTKSVSLSLLGESENCP